MSDLLKITLTFAIILILLRRKINIGYVMLIASAMLFILYRMSFEGIAETVRDTAINRVTITLLLALSLIRMFELILREREVLATMMSSVKYYFSSRRAVIISMPLLIGMLPSLGGAYFSAPMVKEATAGLGMNQEEKAFVNYWFRHPWEYILPLYPGVLLACAITGIALYDLIMANMVYAVAVVITGFMFSMRNLGERIVKKKTSKTKKKEGISFLPIIAVLLLVVFFRMELHYALLLITVPLLIFYKYQPREILRITRHGFTRDVIVLIFGVMLFKETMESSGAVHKLSIFFVEQGIPTLPIFCLLPFITGLLTGLTVGFVGSTFPLLLSLDGGASLAHISLAFAVGFIGVLLSPVHLCLILTREYFKADLWGVYRKMIPGSAVIFIAACIEYLILR
jgi:integral membrane protein (TIGR00529 family)